MNINSEIFETKNVVGGHSRSEKINDVIYEPNGPHIFHTSNEIVNNFGRFPHRNTILGRKSTKEEIIFLKKPGSSF